MTDWAKDYPGSQLAERIRQHYEDLPDQYDRLVHLWYNSPDIQFTTRSGKIVEITPTPSSLERLTRLLHALWTQDRVYVSPMLADGLGIPTEPAVEFLILDTEEG